MLELLLTTTVVVLSLVVPAVSNGLLLRRRERERALRYGAAAREAGLGAVQPKGGVLEAHAGSLQLRISADAMNETTGTRVELWGPRLAPGLELRREGDIFLGLRSRKEIEVGDDDFDRVVSVQGPPALALALLDPVVRRAVATMVTRGRMQLQGHKPLWVSGRLDGGTLRLFVPDQVPFLRPRSSEEKPQAGEVYLDGVNALPSVLRGAADLGQRLLAPEGMAERLAANLKTEPEAGVRRKLIATLLREFPESPATEPAVRAARDDPDADVRVRAAIALGKEGRDVLLGVAGGEGAEDATNARAVAALGASLGLAQVKDLLKSALRTRRVLTAKACLRILAELRGLEAGLAIAKVLLVEKNELGEAAAQALAAGGDPSAEAPLLRALSEAPAEVKRAAAAALGRVGTRAAVQPLRAAESDAALRAAARQAIAEIHSRLSGAEQGQLSLAEGQAGQLSLADGEGGRLSLADDAGALRS
jgi:hypothetical protein